MRSPSSRASAEERRRRAAVTPAAPARSRAHRPRRLQRRHLGPGAVAQHPAVHQPDGARAAGRQLRLVGDQDDGVAAGVELAEEPDDLLAGLRVEVAGRLVGQQQRRARPPGPGRWRRAGAGRRRARSAGGACGWPAPPSAAPARPGPPLLAARRRGRPAAARRWPARWPAAGAGRSGRRSRSPGCAGRPAASSVRVSTSAPLSR